MYFLMINGRVGVLCDTFNDVKCEWYCSIDIPAFWNCVSTFLLCTDAIDATYILFIYYFILHMCVDDINQTALGEYFDRLYEHFLGNLCPKQIQ